MIEYLCDSEEITLSGVEERTKGKLRKKVGELYRSLQGFFREHHRYEIQSFLRIIDCLEEQISAARRAYNAAVTDYNNAVEMFPTNMVASMMSYRQKKWFEIPEEQRRQVDAEKLLES